MSYTAHDSERDSALKGRHTPGPWERFGPGDMSIGAGPKDEYGIPQNIVVGGCGCCGSPYGADDHDEHEANAHLIAAAPEMLEALYAALPYIEAAESDPAYKPGAVAKVTAQVKKAIEKAEGRA